MIPGLAASRERGLHARVVDVLGTEIVDGRLAVGSTLNLDELAVRFTVSRSVLREALRVQRERTADAIAMHFPAGTRLNLPPGGLQLWVELPPGGSARAVFDGALAEHILVAPGTLFSNTARCDGFLRINCGIPWSPVLADGLRRLGEIAGQATARRPPPPAQSSASSASAA